MDGGEADGVDGEGILGDGGIELLDGDLLAHPVQTNKRSTIIREFSKLIFPLSATASMQSGYRYHYIQSTTSFISAISIPL